jgi:SAM-dependent methyltransferase
MTSPKSRKPGEGSAAPICCLSPDSADCPCVFPGAAGGVADREEAEEDKSRPWVHYYLRLRSPGVPLTTFAFDMAHYIFAETYVRGKTVLDAATGKGYGSYHLMKVGKARGVVGIDLDEAGLAYAGEKYRLRGLFFKKMDVTAMSFANDSFDVVVSFETLEHVRPAETPRFMREVVRVLRPDGVFVVSTPNRPVYSASTRTPDHLNEMDFDELRRVLFRYFRDCRFYYQGGNWSAYLREKGNPGFRGIVASAFNRRFLRLSAAICEGPLGRWVGEGRFMRLLKERRVRPARCPEEVRGSLLQLAVCRGPRKSCSENI